MRGLDRRYIATTLRPVPKMRGSVASISYPDACPPIIRTNYPLTNHTLFTHSFCGRVGYLVFNYITVHWNTPWAFKFQYRASIFHCAVISFSLSLSLFLLSVLSRLQLDKEKEKEKASGKTGLPVWMLGLGTSGWEDDMTRLLALLFHQGVLDEQFMQLQQLQDESSPNFVSEVISIYFRESEKLLRNLRTLLADRECTDYKKIGVHLNHLMGSSSSIGANLVRNVCVRFRTASEHCNRFGCLRSLAVLEQEYCYLKNKLLELFQIEQQRVMASGVRYGPRLQ